LVVERPDWEWHWSVERGQTAVSEEEVVEIETLLADLDSLILRRVFSSISLSSWPPWDHLE
jgi:hypothetical protein